MGQKGDWKRDDLIGSGPERARFESAYYDSLFIVAIWCKAVMGMGLFTFPYENVIHGNGVRAGYEFSVVNNRSGPLINLCHIHWSSAWPVS